MPTKKTKPQLDYLFEAEFSDGNSYIQGEKDQSLLDPPDKDGNGKSAFYDVLQRIDEVQRFSLFKEDYTATVDLTDGSFVVNDMRFTLHDDLELTAPLKLVYYRKTRVEQIVGQDGSDLGHRHFVASYHIGWQMLGKDGKNITHVIAIV